MGEDYILGINETEFDRLKFQHSVWGGLSRELFSRLKISKGMNCLDVGSGPGFVSVDIRELVGDEGKLTVLEPSGEYLNFFKSVVSKNNWDNVKFIQGSVEDSSLEDNFFDFIFVRWVIAFVPNPIDFLKILIRSLKKDGILAVQDYAGKGPALFPEGGGFENAFDILKKYWAHGGGDFYIGNRLPEIFSKLGLQIIDFKPNCLAGGPDSGVFNWADKFFTIHIPKMVEMGIISKDYAAIFLDDWNDHKVNKYSIFFSPLVVDVCGRKIF